LGIFVSRRDRCVGNCGPISRKNGSARFTGSSGDLPLVGCRLRGLLSTGKKQQVEQQNRAFGISESQND
jgi:hypothetical protein